MRVKTWERVLVNVLTWPILWFTWKIAFWERASSWSLGISRKIPNFCYILIRKTSEPGRLEKRVGTRSHFPSIRSLRVARKNDLTTEEENGEEGDDLWMLAIRRSREPANILFLARSAAVLVHALRMRSTRYIPSWRKVACLSQVSTVITSIINTFTQWARKALFEG